MADEGIFPSRGGSADHRRDRWLVFRRSRPPVRFGRSLFSRTGAHVRPSAHLRGDCPLTRKLLSSARLRSVPSGLTAKTQKRSRRGPRVAGCRSPRPSRELLNCRPKKTTLVPRSAEIDRIDDEDSETVEIAIERVRSFVYKIRTTGCRLRCCDVTRPRPRPSGRSTQPQHPS